ncbi:MAG: hypothetical protein ACKO9T_06190, partial [Nitrospira sp.]
GKLSWLLTSFIWPLASSVYRSQLTTEGMPERFREQKPGMVRGAANKKGHVCARRQVGAAAGTVPGGG